jgi:hypothetical protein
MFHLRPPLGLHLSHGRQPRPDMALTFAMHLVCRRTQCRYHMLLRADAEVSHFTLLAQVPQLNGLQLRVWPSFRSRRLRCDSRQLELQCFEKFYV